MIRALQKKFVITSMTAISVLLLVLLGGINITNIVLSEKETSRTLGWITAQELGEFPDKPFSGNKSTAPDADKPPEPPSPFGQERNAKDAILSSNYFVVRTDLTGEVLSTDVTRVSTLSEEDAAALASAIWQAADTDGTSGRYKYSVRADEEKEEVVLIFLDTSQDLLSSLRVLLLSAALGVLCWILMLLLVILLSKRAIRPFAENMQKQKQFVTNAGHEIKTPLAIILANTRRDGALQRRKQMEPKYPRTGEPLKRSDEKPAHTGADGRGHLADHTDRLFLQCTRTRKCRCLRRAVCAATDHYAIRYPAGSLAPRGSGTYHAAPFDPSGKCTEIYERRRFCNGHAEKRGTRYTTANRQYL